MNNHIILVGSPYSEFALYFLSKTFRDRSLVDQYHGRISDYSFFEQLKQLTASDIEYIASKNPNLAQVTIDIKGLELGMKVIEQQKIENEKLEWLIRNGANRSVILQEFPALDDKKIKEMINFLSDYKPKPGRVPTIQGKSREAVEHKWYEIDQQNPDLTNFDKLRLLKEAFPEYDLARLNTVVRNSL